MAKLDFHPEAARAIDARGEALLSKISEHEPKQERPAFRSQRIPHHEITEDMIVGRVTGQRVDEYKNETIAIFFEGDDGPAELGAEGVKDLDKLNQLIHKSLAAKTAVSVRFLRDGLIDWMQRKYRNEVKENLSDFLLSIVAEAVALRTIVIPVANLCLEEDLSFGPVDFKVLTADMMTTWYESYRRTATDIAALDEWFSQLRKEVQGLAAVSFTVEADEDYAIEQGLEKAEQAVALLRVLHPVNTSPYTALYVRPLGSENLESYHAYCYEAGLYKRRRGHVRSPFPSPWKVPAQERHSQALQNLIYIFSAQERTDFQQRLLEALLIYSRNNTSKEAYEKLIFCLVAVESMLLKNPSEPIVDNIGERMAYLLGSNAKERLEIEALVKRTYDIRSKFVHHGQRPTDMNTLACFMMKAWTLFLHFILNIHKISSKNLMIEELKSHKYR